MSTDQPAPGSGSGDDPFAKRPQDSGGGGPYEQQPPPSPPPPPGAEGPSGGPPPGGPYGGPPPGGPYGGGPYGAAPPDPLAGMPPLADGGKRLLARIIDIVIVLIPVALIDMAFGGFQTQTDTIDAGRSALQSLVAAVFFVGYDWWMTRSTGQTLGKKWMNLRVANLADGSVPDATTSLIRAAVLWLPAVFCCACIWTAICGGWSIFDKPYKQGLHDKAAKTVVVTA